MMKLAYYVYPVAFQSPGGGEIALLKTKEYIEKEGVPVRLLDPWNDKLKSFDILHTFGSVKDCLRMMETAKEVGIKNVLSTICWYSLKSAWGSYPSFKTRSISVARHLAKSLLPFLPSERKRMMEISDLLLPNSQTEADQLKRFFRIPEEKIRIIPNGVDPKFEDARPEPFIEKYGLKDFILIVGRIEPRKNQLNVIRALKGIRQPVVIIGDYVTAYKDYYNACRREADKNVHFLGGLPHDSNLLSSAYAACNTFLLATWLETPGLAALEAGLAGAKVVITDQGATYEYFNDFAAYVRPDNPVGIRKVTLAVFERSKDAQLKQRIQKNYLWSVVAQKTIQAYREILPA
jgi:glycosyltransferase involved in cell wall biosynthesis